MSFQAMTWAVDQQLPTNEKMVLLMLANRTNSDTGRCDPSRKRLADDCGMSVSTLKRTLANLESMGLIRIVGRTRDDGTSASNQYQLLTGGGGQVEPLGGQVEPVRGSDWTGGGGQPEPQTRNYNQEVKPVGDSGESTTPNPDKQKTTKARQLPKDFEPNDTNRRVAAEQGVSIHDELPQFIDHHLAKGSVMKDWHRALNTWLRNARRFGGGAAAPPPSASPRPAPDNPYGDY